jgi:hypothetical protein
VRGLLKGFIHAIAEQGYLLGHSESVRAVEEGRSLVSPALFCQQLLLAAITPLRLLFLSSSLDMLDHRPKFFSERLVAVIDTIQVSTCSGHALNNPTRLFDVLFTHLVQRELR